MCPTLYIHYILQKRMQDNHYNNGLTIDFIDEGSEAQRVVHLALNPRSAWFQSLSCFTL